MPRDGGKVLIGYAGDATELRRRAYRARLNTNLMRDADAQGELLAYAKELEARATTEETALGRSQIVQEPETELRRRGSAVSSNR